MEGPGSVERANEDLENMLSTLMESNSTAAWADEVGFVQMMKNRSYHHGIKCSPYEAMFGQLMKVGLKMSNLPEDVIANLNSEEDLEEVINSMSSATNDQESIEGWDLVPENDDMREVKEEDRHRCFAGRGKLTCSPRKRRRKEGQREAHQEKMQVQGKI